MSGRGRTTYPSLDLGWMGIWIYKIPGYFQSIKLILRAMPTQAISCQVVIWAGRCSNTSFWKLCFIFPFLTQLFICFLLFINGQNLNKMRMSCKKTFSRASLWWGRRKAHSSISSSRSLRLSRAMLSFLQHGIRIPSWGSQLPFESPAYVAMCCHLDAI